MNPAETSKDGRRIRRMFAGIAGRYDLLNHLLSLNIDRSWRRAAVRLLDPRPGERILDLCSGTADLALELSRALGRRSNGSGPGTGLVVGADFCLEMLRRGAEKARRAEGRGGPGAPVRLGAGDALRLPFADETFDAAAVAFGIRNLAHLESGLAEMRRVLRPGGRAAILEFTRPSLPGFRWLFGLYFHRVLPAVGRIVSRARDPVAREAYSYLPASVEEFPDVEGLADRLARAGFGSVRYRRLAPGIAAVHLGERPAGSGRRGGR